MPSLSSSAGEPKQGRGLVSSRLSKRNAPHPIAFCGTDALRWPRRPTTMTFAELNKEVAAALALSDPAKREAELGRLRWQCTASNQRSWFKACRHWLYETPALDEPLPAPWLDALFPPNSSDRRIVELHWQIVRAAREHQSRSTPPQDVLAALAKATGQPPALARELAYELCEQPPGTDIGRSGGGCWTLPLRPAVRAVSLIMLLVKSGELNRKSLSPGVLLRLTLELVESGQGELVLATPLLFSTLTKSFHRSLEHAKSWAEATCLWKADHDVRLRLAWPTGNAPLPLVLDGDSAGLAFGIGLGMLLAESESGSQWGAPAPELEFVAATGALEPDGAVKPVGAVDIHAKLGDLFHERVRLGHLRWLLHWEGEEGVPPAWKGAASVPRALGVTRLDDALKKLTDELGPKQRIREVTRKRGEHITFLRGEAKMDAVFQDIRLTVPPPVPREGERAEKPEPPKPLPIGDIFRDYEKIMERAGRLDRRIPQMVVTGNPGEGKSVLLDHLAYATARRLAPFDQLARLPVHLVLCEWEAWIVQAKPAPHERTLAHYLAASAYAPGVTFAYWRNAFARGELLILADGLEAITHDSTFAKFLHAQVREWTEAGKDATRNAVVLGCRTTNFSAHAGFFPQLERFELTPFTDEQREKFVRAYPQLGEARAEALLGQFKAKPALNELASTPALLDVICFLSGEDKPLAEDARQLRSDVVDALLAVPPRREGPQTVAFPSKQELEDKRAVLARTLFALYQEVGKGRFSPEQFKAALVTAVTAERGSRDMAWVDAYREFFKHHTRLVQVARGKALNDRVLEFAAGEGLALEEAFAARAEAVVRNADDWREVLKHACWLRMKKKPTTGPEEVRELIGRLAGESQPTTDLGWRKAILAGEIALEFQDALGLKETENEPLLNQVKQQLVQMIEQESLPENRRRTMRRGLSVPERARGGSTLGWLGDARPGVGLRPDGLPDIKLSDVILPAGDFTLLGLGAKRRNHQLRIPKPYRLAVYPVTASQFEAFFRTGGYDHVGFWVEAELMGYWRLNEHGKGECRDSIWARWTDKWSLGPRFLHTPKNHPIIVNWFEAMAFCRWLTQRFRALPVGDKDRLSSQQELRLPLEAEWEQGARWNATIGRADERYALNPWGLDLNSGHDLREWCNGAEWGNGAEWHNGAAELGTTAVGLFPRGRVECGAIDMAGNVWEWCELQGEYAVVRGGSCGVPSPVCIAASRNDNLSQDLGDHGFRCVMA